MSSLTTTVETDTLQTNLGIAEMLGPSGARPKTMSAQELTTNQQLGEHLTNDNMYP